MSGYTIRELIIKIHSNILKDKDNYDVFEFTKNNIYLPDSNKKFNKVLNTYPYFTYEFKYPRDKLLSLNMRKRIETFFNLEQFVLYITTYGEKSKTDTSKEIDECAYENLMIMLEVLFPTQFPIYNNIKDSYNYYVNGNRSLQRHMLSMITQPFTKKYYSYMKHNGETYTISKVIWINDMLNHSIYSDLIEKYQEYIKSSKSTSLKREFNNYLKPLLSHSTSSERYKSIYINFQDKIDEIQNEENKTVKKTPGRKSQSNVAQVNHILYHANKCYYEIASSTNEDKEDNLLGNNNDYNCQNNSNNFDLNTSILENHKGKKVYYYIELAIDYFQGEFNNKNKSMYVCNYTSNHLGDLLEKILMTKELAEKSQYWNIDLDRAPLYNKTSSLKQEKTIKLDDTNDNEDNKEDKYVQLFSEILDEGMETINALQGSDSIEDIGELYRFYNNNKRGDTNYIEEVYKLKQKPGSNTLLVSSIESSIANLRNTNPIYKAMLDDILNYVKQINDVKLPEKGGNTNSGKHMTRKLKKKRFNVTIKKN